MQYLTSISRTSDPTAQNFFPVSSRYTDSDILGTLEPKDTEWTCPGGSGVESQRFCCFTENGLSVKVQLTTHLSGEFPLLMTYRMLILTIGQSLAHHLIRDQGLRSEYQGYDLAVHKHL